MGIAFYDFCFFLEILFLKLSYNAFYKTIFTFNCTICFCRSNQYINSLFCFNLLFFQLTILSLFQSDLNLFNREVFRFKLYLIYEYN